MTSQLEIVQFLKSNKSFICSEFHITRIGIFGSYARNEQNDESDIDILIELEHHTQGVFDLKWALREFLEQHFKRSVDICNVKHIKPFAKEYILKDAIYV